MNQFHFQPNNEAFCISMLEHFRTRLQKRVVFCDDQEYKYLLDSKNHYEQMVTGFQIKALITEVNNLNNEWPAITC